MRIFSNEYIDGYNKRKLELSEEIENLKEKLNLAKKKYIRENTPENKLIVDTLTVSVENNEKLLNDLTKVFKEYNDNIEEIINKKSDMNESKYFNTDNLKYIQLLEFDDETYTEEDEEAFEHRKKIREELGKIEPSLVNKITTQQTTDEPITPNNINSYIDAIKNIVENILGLTPEEYDAVYSTAFNKNMVLNVYFVI